MNWYRQSSGLGYEHGELIIRWRCIDSDDLDQIGDGCLVYSEAVMGLDSVDLTA